MATAILLDARDGSPVNLQAGSYQVTEPVDWGARAIAETILSGGFRPEEYDAALRAGGVLRQVVLPLRVKTASTDALQDALQAISYRLTKASRAAPIDLDVTPHGSTVVSTFRVVGGSLDDGEGYTRVTETANLARPVLTLQCLPFVLGPVQQLGSNLAPLLTNQLAPVMLDVQPAAGAEGDVPADVTIHFHGNSTTGLDIQYGALFAACLSGLRYWKSFFEAGDMYGTGTAAPARQLYYRSGWNFGSGGGQPWRETPTAANTVHEGPILTFSAREPRYTTSGDASKAPAGVPLRLFVAVLDTATLASGNRGKLQIRAKVTGGGTIYTDWVSPPPGAVTTGGVGLETLIDLGIVTFPVNPIPAEAAAQDYSIRVELQYQTSQASGWAPVDFDYVMLIPDASHMIAEALGVDHLAAGRGTFALRSEGAYDDEGAPLAAVITGPQIRARGVTRYVVGLYAAPLASNASTLSFQHLYFDAWATYRPRYLGLA